MITRAPGPLLVVGVGLCALAFSTAHPMIMAAVLVVAVALLLASRTPARGVLLIAGILGVGVAVLNPFVQPKATTPPTPMQVAPTRWLARSSTPPKPSQRKLPSASAITAAPTATPATVTMPSVSTLAWSLKYSTQSSA